jgi:hypothetical protein
VFGQVDSTTNRLVVLDPRRWTLLNGKDSESREDIRALLGQGANAVTVDSAASCVVACVNTQRRKTAYSRAADVLAWKYVLQQLDADADGEVTDARAKLAEASSRLDSEVAKAFQHYAYLLRSGNELVIEFRRFDDDARSALRGPDVWTQLVVDARATTVGHLSGAYLATLLDTFERALTPLEIVQAFYKNPSFPLVPSTDEIRSAIYDLVASGEWQLVDSAGVALAVTSAGHIQINSIQQTLSRRPAGEPFVSGGGTSSSRSETDGQPADGGKRDDAGETLPAPDAAGTDNPSDGPVQYKRYRVSIANRSITSADARTKVWGLLRELSRVIDAANDRFDHQLINLDVTLTTADGDVLGLEAQAEAADAKFSMESEDF